MPKVDKDEAVDIGGGSPNAEADAAVVPVCKTDATSVVWSNGVDNWLSWCWRTPRNISRTRNRWANRSDEAGVVEEMDGRRIGVNRESWVRGCRQLTRNE